MVILVKRGFNTSAGDENQPRILWESRSKIPYVAGRKSRPLNFIIPCRNKEEEKRSTQWGGLKARIRMRE